MPKSLNAFAHTIPILSIFNIKQSSSMQGAIFYAAQDSVIHALSIYF